MPRKGTTIREPREHLVKHDLTPERNARARPTPWHTNPVPDLDTHFARADSEHHDPMH
jgi:hypothetical protein